MKYMNKSKLLTVLVASLLSSVVFAEESVQQSTIVDKVV